MIGFIGSVPGKGHSQGMLKGKGMSPLLRFDEDRISTFLGNQSNPLFCGFHVVGAGVDFYITSVGRQKVDGFVQLDGGKGIVYGTQA